MSLIVNGIEIESVVFNNVKVKTLNLNNSLMFDKPIISDGGVDWYGEVPSGELITGDALASLIGLTAGTSQYSTAGWLHVGIDGQELLIAKRPFRANISWSDLNAVNVVNGNRTLTIQGQDYKIRLMKAGEPTVINESVVFDPIESHNSEWNRIFYRLTNNNSVNANNIKTSEEPFVHLGLYSEEDLILHNNFGNGSHNWCQHQLEGLSVLRGYQGVSRWRMLNSSQANDNRGWRPVLEKV